MFRPLLYMLLSNIKRHQAIWGQHLRSSETPPPALPCCLADISVTPCPSWRQTLAPTSQASASPAAAAITATCTPVSYPSLSLCQMPTCLPSWVLAPEHLTLGVSTSNGRMLPSTLSSLQEFPSSMYGTSVHLVIPTQTDKVCISLLPQLFISDSWPSLYKYFSNVLLHLHRPLPLATTLVWTTMNPQLEYSKLFLCYNGARIIFSKCKPAHCLWLKSFNGFC